MTRRFSTVLATAAAMTLALAACGGDSNTTDDSTSPDAAGAPSADESASDAGGTQCQSYGDACSGVARAGE